MKQIFKGIIVLLLVFSASKLKAQIAAIDFTITSESIHNSGQDIAISSTINKTGNTVIWTQLVNGNTNTTDYTIISISGNWDLNTSLGSVTYTMHIEGQQTELILTGQESGISAILKFKITETQEEQYTFNIDTITYQ